MVNEVTNKEKTKAEREYVIQKVQPALLGLMDGSVSTLAPIFATAGLTGQPMKAFYVGLAASLGAGISMGLAEALSDDGTVTGRGNTHHTRCNYCFFYRIWRDAAHAAVFNCQSANCFTFSLCGGGGGIAYDCFHTLQIHENAFAFYCVTSNCRWRDCVYNWYLLRKDRCLIFAEYKSSWLGFAFEKS